MEGKMLSCTGAGHGHFKIKMSPTVSGYIGTSRQDDKE